MDELIDLQKIYSGNEPMKVFWMFSGGASSLRAALDDPNNNVLYKNVGAYTDKEDAKGRKLCDDHRVPHFFLSRKEFYSRNGLDPRQLDSRRRFYDMLREKIDAEYSPDIVCLSGYMHIVNGEILDYKPILNVHPADLSILSGTTVKRLDASQISAMDAKKLSETNKLARKFKGEDAVFDAICACEPATRSTIHLATEIFDEGPIVVQSKAFDVDPKLLEQISVWHVLDGVTEYASALQDRMKTEGDGPAYLKALELISQGRVSIDGETLFLDDRELPYCGYRLG